MTSKAVILARGLGTRMQRPGGVALSDAGSDLAGRGLKVLMPVAGRPFVDYLADGLVRAGIRAVCFVVAPEAELMREHGSRIAAAAGIDVSYAVQEQPRGTADAVLAACEFAGDEPFVLCNGDNVYPDSALSRLAAAAGDECWVVAFERDGLSSRGNIAPERARDFSVVSADAEGRLTGIVEKPEDPERFARDGRLWLNMNLYRFTSDIFGACADIEPDPRRGELELTAAVGLLVERGTTPFRVLECEDGVFDLTSRSDVPAAERALKERRLCF